MNDNAGVAAWLRRGVACALIFGAAVPAAAVTVTPSWNGWHWARTGNLRIQVGDNVSSAWDPWLRASAAAWSAHRVIDMVVVPGSTTGRACNPKYGTVQACSANYGKNGWLGWTYAWVSGGHIVQATVKLNDYYFSQAQWNSAAWRQHTMCHELGHTLGLDHNTPSRSDRNTGSCMDYTNDPAGLKSINSGLGALRPGAPDWRGLDAIYNHLDTWQLTSTKTTYRIASAYGIDGPIEFDMVAVPEPASWAMLITGFGLIGTSLRRRRPAGMARA